MVRLGQQNKKGRMGVYVSISFRRECHLMFRLSTGLKITMFRLWQWDEKGRLGV